MSVCLRYAENRDEALEIVNDSFMKVFTNIDKYESDRPFKGWFRRILVNTALDNYRASRKHNELLTSIDELPEEIQTGAETDLQLDADHILQLFSQLTTLHRMVFNLYEIEGFSHDEIGAYLDISPGTSRSALSRAKKKLQYLYINSLSKDKA